MNSIIKKKKTEIKQTKFEIEMKKNKRIMPSCIINIKWRFNQKCRLKSAVKLVNTMWHDINNLIQRQRTKEKQNENIWCHNQNNVNEFKWPNGIKVDRFICYSKQKKMPTQHNIEKHFFLLLNFKLSVLFMASFSRIFFLFSFSHSNFIGSALPWNFIKFHQNLNLMKNVLIGKILSNSKEEEKRNKLSEFI